MALSAEAAGPVVTETHRENPENPEIVVRTENHQRRPENRSG
ncbi:hypothetical protein [Thiolapillus sp.]